MPGGSFGLMTPFVIIGIDDYVEQHLKELDKLDSDTLLFEKTWNEINEHIKLKVKEIINKVYEIAGVNDLLVKEGE